MTSTTEIIDTTVKKPTPEAVEKLLAHAFAEAGEDWQKVANGLAYACVLLSQRENLAVALVEFFAQPPRKGRGRPPSKKTGLYIPVAYRSKRATVGAPKRNDLPDSMKVHALQALTRWESDSGAINNALDAAIHELVANCISPREPLTSNLQRRISEVKRGK
jgi:hypothetical protein